MPITKEGGIGIESVNIQSINYEQNLRLNLLS